MGGAFNSGNTSNDARNGAEIAWIAAVGSVAGIRQIAGNIGIAILARRILHRHVRNDIRCVEDHEIFGLQRFVDRVDRFLVLLTAFWIGDRVAFVTAHGDGIVDKYQRGAEFAVFVGVDQELDRRHHLIETGLGVFRDQRRTASYQNLVGHCQPPQLPGRELYPLQVTC